MSTRQLFAAQSSGSRQPALYGSLVAFLVLNNLAVAARCLTHYRSPYRTTRRISLEDVFIILSGVRGRLPKHTSIYGSHLSSCSWTHLSEISSLVRLWSVCRSFGSNSQTKPRIMDSVFIRRRSLPRTRTCLGICRTSSRLVDSLSRTRSTVSILTCPMW